MTRRLRFFLPAVLLILAGAMHDKARADNIYPLAFGMTPQQVADALGSTLVYIRGRPGSEIFVTIRDAGIPTLLYPNDERYFLQFRRGRLTGWKQDWRLRYGPLF